MQLLNFFSTSIPAGTNVYAITNALSVAQTDAALYLAMVIAILGVLLIEGRIIADLYASIVRFFQAIESERTYAPVKIDKVL